MIAGDTDPLPLGLSLAQSRHEPVPLTWLFNYVKPFRVRVTSTHGGNHVPNSYHYRFRAIDVIGAEDELHRLAAAACRAHNEFNEVFYDPLGRFVKNREVHLGAIGGHSDHVHLAR